MFSSFEYLCYYQQKKLWKLHFHGCLSLEIRWILSTACIILRPRFQLKHNSVFNLPLTIDFNATIGNSKESAYQIMKGQALLDAKPPFQSITKYRLIGCRGFHSHARMAWTSRRLTLLLPGCQLSKTFLGKYCNIPDRIGIQSEFSVKKNSIKNLTYIFESTYRQKVPNNTCKLQLCNQDLITRSNDRFISFMTCGINLAVYISRYLTRIYRTYLVEVKWQEISDSLYLSLKWWHRTRIGGEVLRNLQLRCKTFIYCW